MQFSKSQFLLTLPLLISATQACLFVETSWDIEGYEIIVTDNEMLRCYDTFDEADLPDATTGTNYTALNCEDGYSATVWIKIGDDFQAKLIEYKTPQKTFGPYDMGEGDSSGNSVDDQKVTWQRTWC